MTCYNAMFAESMPARYYHRSFEDFLANRAEKNLTEIPWILEISVIFFQTHILSVFCIFLKINYQFPP